ncbi:hypothetical protein D3C76_1425480 [compost metagenome]
MFAYQCAGNGPLAGAGLRITVLPSSRPRLRAWPTDASGTSSWQMITSAACRTESKQPISAGVSAPLAPATITIAFWLLSSTTISATPLEPSTVLTA